MPDGTAGGASPDLAALCAEVWDWQTSESPITPTSPALGACDARLDERGPAARERRERALSVFHRRLEAVPVEGLEGEDRITRAVLLRSLSEDLEAFRHKAWEWDLDQMEGLHLSVQNVLQVQPVATPRDVERFLVRCEAVPGAFAAWTADLRDGLASGRVSPRVAVDRVRGQVASVVATPPERTTFVTALDRMPESIPEGERRRLKARAAETVARAGLPAYRPLLEFLDAGYAVHARKDVGVWSIPGGEEAYRFRVRRETTTSYTPERIHEIGVEQLEANREEMLEIARGLGNTGEMRPFLDGLGADARFRLPTREAVLERYREICRRMDARLPEVFGILPKAGYEVKPLEAYREADAPAAYYLQPAEDGSRPGTFYANTHDPESWPTYDMEALCHHEAVPGHHLQIAIAQERTDLPLLRRHVGFTAYIEGWAHYAERLADEMGAYSTPHDRIGMLAAQAWRAARLVVDTGMHAMRWTRERAAALLRDIRSGPLSDVSNEVDRYIVWPGQALSYKIGHLTIASLRERARRRLGSRFSLRGFHDAVLRHGALPLSVLETVLAAWEGD